jgi:hypothetical protein
MMVHVVFFRPRPDYSEDRVREVQRTLVREMSAAYPGIESVTSGRTFTDRGGAYSHGAVWRWRDRESWQRQVGDARHFEIARTHFGPMREEFLAFDFQPVT